MTLNRHDVLHVAALARLELSEPEVERMLRDLAQILGYVALLGEADIRDVAPTAQLAVPQAPLRPDEPTHGLSQSQALAAAPRQANGAFAVPAFVEEA
jgi:aspartyl-tRNA(Asn)/glutamyl-tRNA(Gln) amidotransferase subunit C